MTDNTSAILVGGFQIRDGHMVPPHFDPMSSHAVHSKIWEMGATSIWLGPTSFWIQVVLMRVLQACVPALFGLVIYYGIVKQRGSVASYLLGYGIIIPAALYSPFVLIEYFSISNISIMLGVTTIGVLMPFFCIEAMHNTAVVGVENNIMSYLAYYGSIVPFKRNFKTGEPMPVTRKYLMIKTVTVNYKVALLILYFAVLAHYDFVPFASAPERESWYSYLHWAHLLNNFCLILLTSQCIDVGDEGTGLVVSVISGKQVITVMNHPVLCSQSVTDFWSRRWNMTMQGTFKRGIVRPLLRLGAPRWVAVLGTFVASGIMHEYICQVIQCKYRLYPDIALPYVATIGNQLSFFVWNGSVVLMENAFFPKINKLPWPLNTFLVSLTVLPISHWFFDEYLLSGFYQDCSLAIPLVFYNPQQY